MGSVEDRRPSILAKLNHEYVLVDKSNPDRKKKVLGHTKNWNIDEALLYQSSFGGTYKLSCCYYLKDTPFAVFDVDTDDYPYEQFCKDMNIGVSQTMWVKGNTTGYHVWVAFGDNYKKPSDKNIQDSMKNCKGDYLGEKVFERIDKDWEYKNSYPDLQPCILTVNDDMMKSCFNMNKIVKSKKKKDKCEKVYQPSSNETLEKICNLILPSHLEARSKYLSIIIAMKNCGLSREFAIEFSNRSDKFDKVTELYGLVSPEDFDNFWEYANDDFEGNPLTEATLHKYAKESNEEQYNLLVKPIELSLAILEKGAYCVSNVISPTLKESLIYCDKSWYTVDKITNLWKIINKPSYIVVTIIHSFLNKGLSILLDQLKNIDSEDTDKRKSKSQEISYYSSYYSKCDSSSYLSNMFNHLSNSLGDIQESPVF